MNEYRHLIKKILSEYIELDKRQPAEGIEYLLIADDERGHYLWLNLGWKDGKRINAETIYVRIVEGKFCIETDWTENGIAEDLIAAGVPEDDIVLAFQPPSIRHLVELEKAA
jgi:hypothetical protein